MWPFTSKPANAELKANSVEFVDGQAVIDVRGQTCPGYLLTINKEVDKLEQGIIARLLITYPPCDADVKAWCRERDIEYLDMVKTEGIWTIRIRKPSSV